MFDRVLIPLDGSKLSENALLPLRRLLAARRPEVHLLRVVEPGGPVRTTERTETECDEAWRELEALRERLRDREGLEVHARVVLGDPAEQILAQAREGRADLIAMSTHGRSGLSRLLRGSVAERVLRESEVPLLLLNPNGMREEYQAEQGPFRRIVVPLDGSDLAAAALEPVESLARAHGAEVVLLRVDERPVPVSLAAEAPADAPDAATADDLQWQQERLRQRGVTARVEVARGPAAAKILQAAQDADLVALSSHGRSGPSRWWFGSVAEHVVRECARPLLVVRPAAVARQAEGTVLRAGHETVVVRES